MNSNFTNSITDQEQTEETVVESFEWKGKESAAVAVVTAVASVRGMRPRELQPLGSFLDTDALNSLFASKKNSNRLTGYLQFTYEECLVRVTADGRAIAVPARD